MPHLIQAIHWVFGLLVWGSGTPSRYLFIVFMSIGSAVLALELFRRLSNQARLKLLRNRIQGNILQIGLYPDRIDILAGSLGAVLADTARSLRESIVPLVVMSFPIALVMIEVNTWCGSAPFGGGDEFTIRVQETKVPGQESIYRALSLEPSPGIELRTGALRIPEESSLYWRARVNPSAGQEDLVLRIRGDAGGTAEKRIAAGIPPRRFGPKTAKWSFPEGVVTNSEGFLPSDAPVSLIEVSYPRAGYWFLGWHVDALVFYIILTLAVAAAVKPFMGVHL